MSSFQISSRSSDHQKGTTWCQLGRWTEKSNEVKKGYFAMFWVPWIFRVECRCSGLHWWQPHWLDTSRQTSHRRWKRWKLSIVGEFTSDFIWSADLCLKHLYCCSSSFSFPIMSQMTDFCQKLPLVHDFYGERKSRVVWICSQNFLLAFWSTDLSSHQSPALPFPPVSIILQLTQSWARLKYSSLPSLLSLQ